MASPYKTHKSDMSTLGISVLLSELPLCLLISHQGEDAITKIELVTPHVESHFRCRGQYIRKKRLWKPASNVFLAL
jgi:hypothetical protein